MPEGRKNGEGGLSYETMREVICDLYTSPVKSADTAKLLPSLEIDRREVMNKVTEFLEKETRKRGFRKLLVPLSGGVDSATVAVISDGTGFDTKLVTVTDKEFMRPEDVRDAKIVADYFDLKHEVIDASDTFRTIDESDPLIRQHTMMGFRKALIYSIGEKEDRIVVSGGNKTELYLGLFCCNNILGELFPLGDLFKTQIYQLARYAGLPVDAKPSHSGVRGDADDETLLGMKFYEFDLLAHYLVDRNYSPERTAEQIGHAYNLDALRRMKKVARQNVLAMKFPFLKVA
ncbi:MAG: NAD(+) synthase [Candidatus Aenigmarchaeota archaeon]|nr:NAD(+) synthase [Candidatus Aenigmarchaeota archaeon]